MSCLAVTYMVKPGKKDQTHELHRSATHFVEHVVNGLISSAESRSPKFYEPVTGWAGPAFGTNSKTR
jgi:hypothetical protein